MALVRYWDHQARERALLTEEEVTKLLDFELMEKGVLKVLPMTLQTVPLVPELKQTKFFEVGGIVFDSAEKAEQFLALNPMSKDYEYSVSSKHYYSKPLQGTIRTEMLCDHTDILNAASALKAAKAADESNEAERRRHLQESKEVDKVLAHVWDDWNEQRVAKAKHEKLASTLQEYLAMTGGDYDLAVGFLLKAYTVEQIEEANAFLGSTIPTMTAPKAAQAQEAMDAAS